MSSSFMFTFLSFVEENVDFTIQLCCSLCFICNLLLVIVIAYFHLFVCDRFFLSLTIIYTAELCVSNKIFLFERNFCYRRAFTF